MSRPERSLIAACCATAAFWGLVALGGVEVQVGRADLPDFSSAFQAVDPRLGERRIEDARSDVDARFVREKQAYDRELGGIAAEVGSPVETLARSQELAATYQREFVHQARAQMTAAYFQQGYADMLQEHVGQLSVLTDIQEKVNGAQQKINLYNQIYVRTKFLMGR